LINLFEILMNPSWAHHYPTIQDIFIVILTTIFIESIIAGFIWWIASDDNGKIDNYTLCFIIMVANIVSGIMGLGLLPLMGYW
jgi:hypothetical protein